MGDGRRNFARLPVRGVHSDVPSGLKIAPAVQEHSPKRMLLGGHSPLWFLAGSAHELRETVAAPVTISWSEIGNVNLARRAVAAAALDRAGHWLRAAVTAVALRTPHRCFSKRQCLSALISFENSAVTFAVNRAGRVCSRERPVSSPLHEAAIRLLRFCRCRSLLAVIRLGSNGGAGTSL